MRRSSGQKSTTWFMDGPVLKRKLTIIAYHNQALGVSSADLVVKVKKFNPRNRTTIILKNLTEF